MAIVSDLIAIPRSGVGTIDALLEDGPPWNYQTTTTGSILYFTFGEALAQSAAQTSVRQFNTGQSAAARQVLGYVESLTGIDFVETGDAATADFHFASADILAPGVSALAHWEYSYTYTPASIITECDAEAYIYLDIYDFAENLSPLSGTSGYQTLLHEIGHALGLKHPFEGSPTLPEATDDTDHTLMSYNWVGGNKTAFQEYDLAALWWLYGGDGLGGIYGLNSVVGPTLPGVTPPVTPPVGDTTPPALIDTRPADGATAVPLDSDIVLTFTEAIQRGAGSIVIRTAEGTTAATFDAAASPCVTIAGNTLTLNPVQDLAYATHYLIEIASGSVKDLAGNSYGGTASYDFTTAADPTLATNGDDTVVGSSRADTLVGLAGNDRISGGGGNDAIDGGDGRDTALFVNPLADYSLAQARGVVTVRADAGTDGTDTLTNVEKLRFADITVNLTVQATAAAVPAAVVQHLAELYVAFFNRVPDADGLEYWIGRYQAGTGIDSIAEAFYAAGIAYAGLTGFSAAMSNADVVNVVYRHVLGRSTGADADGLAYWGGALDQGLESRGSLVSTILESAHTFKGDATWGWVADLLDNKMAVANLFAIQYGLNFNTPEVSIARGMEIAAAVTPTDTHAAITLIGVGEDQIVL